MEVLVLKAFSTTIDGEKVQYKVGPATISKDAIDSHKLTKKGLVSLKKKPTKET